MDEELRKITDFDPEVLKHGLIGEFEITNEPVSEETEQNGVKRKEDGYKFKK